MTVDSTSNPTMALWLQSMHWALQLTHHNHFNTDVADVGFNGACFSALDEVSVNLFQGKQVGKREEKRGRGVCMSKLYNKRERNKNETLDKNEE